MLNRKPTRHIMAHSKTGVPYGRGAIAEEIRSVIENCLGYHPSLRLIGSWASNEPHLPPKINDWIHSFSDIDLIYGGVLRAHARSAIISQLHQAAESVQVHISTVSLRTHREMSALPHAVEWNLTDQSPSFMPNAAQYLRFWTAISAIESAIRKYQHDEEDLSKVASYCIAKFFFTLVRNIGILRALKFQSYVAISQWVNAEWKGLPFAEAYYIKIGSLTTLEATTAEQLIGTKAVERLLGHTSFSSETSTIAILARDLLNLLQHGKELRPLLYLQIAQECAYNSPLSRVVEYERRKLMRIRPLHLLEAAL